MIITDLKKTIGWKIEPQTKEEHTIALSMIEALEYKTNNDVRKISDDSQAID